MQPDVVAQRQALGVDWNAHATRIVSVRRSISRGIRKVLKVAIAVASFGQQESYGDQGNKDDTDP